MHAFHALQHELGAEHRDLTVEQRRRDAAARAQRAAVLARERRPSPARTRATANEPGPRVRQERRLVDEAAGRTTLRQEPLVDDGAASRNCRIRASNWRLAHGDHTHTPRRAAPSQASLTCKKHFQRALLRVKRHAVRERHRADVFVGCARVVSRRNERERAARRTGRLDAEQPQRVERGFLLCDAPPRRRQTCAAVCVCARANRFRWRP